MRPPTRLALLTAIAMSATAPQVVTAHVAQAANKILGTVRPNEALVYFVRAGQPGFTFRVFVDDQFAGTLRNKSYTFACVPAGTHLVWGTMGRYVMNAIALDVAGGQTYYVDIKLERILPIPETEGRARVEKAESYQPWNEQDASRANKDGREKWPRVKAKYTERQALGDTRIPYSPPSSTDGMTRVPAHTRIPAELMENLSSAASKIGDPVWLRTTADVLVGETVVVRKGTIVKALVRDMKKANVVEGPGLLDVSALSVAAVDATVCPVLSQIVRAGGEESQMARALGPFSILFSKAKESCLLAGETVSVFTREDVWVGSPSTNEMRGEDPRAAVTASLSGPIRCDLPKGRGPESVPVFLDARDEIVDIRLFKVAGSELPAPLAPNKIQRLVERVSAQFGGWDVCRYLWLRPEGVPLTFRVTAKDGSVVYAEALAVIDVK